MIAGRAAERARLLVVLDDARAGRGGALLLHGEAGVGKTTLLQSATENASGMTVVTARGVESEAQLAFSGLHQLLRPLLRHIDSLPESQSAALRSALGLAAAAGVEPLAVAGATLNLLTAAGDAQPLLVAVDDLQWLDHPSADALLFAVRRLQADPVAVVLAARAGDDGFPLPRGIPAIAVRGLAVSDVAALLTELTSVAPHPDVAERLSASTAGNPLAVKELAATLSIEQLRGREPIDEPLALGQGLTELFGASTAALGPAVAAGLVVAAAAGDAPQEAVAAAIRSMGGDPTALRQAEDAGLLRLGRRSVEFRHPLVRSAIYHGAPPSLQRAAHRALAGALTGQDAERAAWQLAAATAGVDERAATGLEAVAVQGLNRGAARAATAAWQRAAELSPEPKDRQRRLARAAQAALLGGELARAERLLDAATGPVADPRVRAELMGLRGRLCRLRGHALAAHDLMAEAGRQIAPHDGTAAVVLLTDAVDAALEGGAPSDALETARLIPPLASESGEAAFLADLALGTALGCRGELSEGARLIHRATSRLDADPRLANNPRHQLAAASARAAAGQFGLARPHFERAVQLGRELGTLGTLPEALVSRAWHEKETGRWRSAYALATEALDLAQEASQDFVVCNSLEVLVAIEAAQGRGDMCAAHAEQALQVADRLGLARMQLLVRRHLALLDVGTGHLQAACDRLEQLVRWVDRIGLTEAYSSPLPELFEAYVRAGDVRAALALLPVINARFEARPMPASRAACCRGLVADERSFDGHFAEAVELGTQGGVLFQLARTHLCYGERLRRSRRRREARGQLRAAIEIFDQLDARPWATRARAEMQATGETVRTSPLASTEPLTPQELQVAMLVAEGRSSREVGQALYLSTRTVEFHLTRIFRKLGVSSRRELIRSFATERLITA